MWGYCILFYYANYNQFIMCFWFLFTQCCILSLSYMVCSNCLIGGIRSWGISIQVGVMCHLIITLITKEQKKQRLHFCMYIVFAFLDSVIIIPFTSTYSIAIDVCSYVVAGMFHFLFYPWNQCSNASRVLSTPIAAHLTQVTLPRIIGIVLMFLFILIACIVYLVKKYMLV
jgi:hypothetical protein